MFGVSTVTESAAGKAVQFAKLLLHTPWYNPLRLMNANKAVFGVNRGHMWKESEKISALMHEIISGVEDGWIRPHVDRAFPFDQAGQAHAYIEARKNIGKIVLTTDG